MTKTKEFKTLAVASVATGIGMMKGLRFSDMQEISEFVLGHQVWTHELADKAMTARVEAAIRSQLPAMPSHEAAGKNWSAAAADALFTYGETVLLSEGSETRAENPIASLARMTGRPEDIIAVVADGATPSQAA